MRVFWLVLLLAFAAPAHGQELYVSSEPASNMPAHSIGIRINQEFMPFKAGNDGRSYDPQLMYRLNPELMLGLHKNWMVHANVYASNMHQTAFRPEASALYVKWRFFSVDEIHSHFRLAAYAKAAVSNNPIHYHDINLGGDNSGATAGIIATKLIHKLALSATGGYLHSTANMGQERPNGFAQDAFNYSLSAGYLTWPVHYTNYNQPNYNIYLEFLGKTNPATHEHYIDIAPAIQVIAKSRMRLEIAYKRQLAGNMYRINNQSIMARFEYSFFNAW
jgi:hypothetical protein